jgi:hypothetical protein
MQNTAAPRFVHQPFAVPDFKQIEEAENYLASLPLLLGRGELDSQTALELSTQYPCAADPGLARPVPTGSAVAAISVAAIYRAPETLLGLLGPFEHLMRGIMHDDAEFRREEATSAVRSHAKH